VLNRKILYLFLFFVTPFSIAQTASWNTPMKSKTGNSFYSFEKVSDSLTYFFSVYPSFLFSSSAYFGSFNQTGNILTRKLTEVIPDASKYDDLSSITLGQKMFIYGLKQDKKESAVIIASILPDLTDYIKIKTLCKIETVDKIFNSGVTASPDGTMAIIYCLTRNEKSSAIGPAIFHFYVFEENGEVAAGKIELDFSKEYADDFKPYLTNNAQVLLSYTCYEKRRTRDKANFNQPLSLQILHIDKDQTEKYSFQYLDHRILSSKVNISKENTLLLTGVYALPNDNILEGLFMFEVNLELKTVENDKFTKFNDKVRHKKHDKKIFGIDLTNTFKDEDWFSDNFELKNVNYTDENMILCFEENYVLETQPMDSRGMINSRPEYFKGDILVLYCDLDGEVLFSNVILKSQRSYKKDDPLHSFNVAVDEDLLHIVFNAPLNTYDQAGNILTWSKRRKKSSKTRLMCASLPNDLSKIQIKPFVNEGLFARRMEINIESFSIIGGKASIMGYNLSKPRNTITQGQLIFPQTLD
jgi:hypothetical protein